MEEYNNLVEAVLSRNAVLFLGAGASATSLLSDGNPVPLGDRLAELLYRQFFPEENYDGEALQITSSLVCATEPGRKALHSFLYNLFNNIKPSEGLLSLAKFYWRNIYTTNIDQALENAYKLVDDKAQEIVPVVGPRDKGAENINTQVSLNKLHGCIARKDVPLVFSLEDYATYKDDHLKLFEKLNSDLVERYVIFIGYSLQDSNFQNEWATIKRYCNPTTMKDRFFFVSPNIKASLEMYLKKEGFTCCNMGIDEFGAFLVNRTKGRRESLTDYYNRNIAPVDLLQAPTLSDEDRYLISTDYLFPLLEIKKPCAKNLGFYKGLEPKWGDLKYNLDATRDILSDLMEDFDRWYSNPKKDFWIITGRAGDGKSTLLKRLSIELASKAGEIVLFADSRSSLDPSKLISFQKSINKPLIVLIDNLTDRLTKVNKLTEFIKGNNAPVLIIGASRNSDWNVTVGSFIANFKEYSLNKLSDNEIIQIIDKLSINDSLGHLENFDELGKRNIFRSVAERELLVALREVITGEKFTDIIASEYSNIKSPEAQTAYLWICLVNQFRYRMPLSLFLRMIDIDSELVREKIFSYLEGMVVFEDTKDQSDYLISTRHSVIAQVVVDLFCKGDVERFESIVNILDHCIPSHPLEMSLVKKLYHYTTITDLFKDKNKGINCYNALAEKFPGDPFILQQKSLFELSFEDFEGSKQSINQALSMNPNSHIFQNTQGTIYLKESLKQEDPVKASYLRDKGKDILMATARKYDSPFHYHSLANKLISWYKNYPTERDKKIIEEIQDILSEATRLYPTDPLIMVEVGRLQEIIPNLDSAKSYFQKAIDISPRNISARYLLAKILIKEDDLARALEICSEGVILKDDEVLLNRLLLEIMHKLGAKEENIIDQYNRYLKTVQHDYFMKLCYGAYLYILEDDFCSDIFSELRINSFLSNSEKHRLQANVDNHINIHNFVENLFVKIETPRGYLLQTERFSSRTLAFCNQKYIIDKVSIGSRIQCSTGFCYMGPLVYKAKVV
ncbi:MAG: SIR2 family protein [Syntrophomonadaceae bacterium]